nr:unnamed protein product [Digitaria exilis]
MEFLQCAMAASMALCSSSMVLSSDDVDTFTDPPTDRCPLFAGDTRSDAGADAICCGPRRRLHPSPAALGPCPVNECGLRRRCSRRLSLSACREKDARSCSTMDAMCLFTHCPTSSALLALSFLLSSAACVFPAAASLALLLVVVFSFLHTLPRRPEKKGEALLLLALCSLSLSLSLLLLVVAWWLRSLPTRPTTGVRDMESGRRSPPPPKGEGKEK